MAKAADVWFRNLAHFSFFEIEDVEGEHLCPTQIIKPAGVGMIGTSAARADGGRIGQLHQSPSFDLGATELPRVAALGSEDQEPVIRREVGEMIVKIVTHRWS